jgi:hypothetical protein
VFAGLQFCNPQEVAGLDDFLDNERRQKLSAAVATSYQTDPAR